jgi:hypothetical protein
MSYTKRRAVMIQNILYYFFYCDSVIVYLGVRGYFIIVFDDSLVINIKFIIQYSMYSI